MRSNEAVSEGRRIPHGALAPLFPPVIDGHGVRLSARAAVAIEPRAEDAVASASSRSIYYYHARRDAI